MSQKRAIAERHAPNGLGFTRRHRPNCRWSALTLNLGMIGGRVQAVLGAPCGASALPANHTPNLQSISRAHIRLSAVYSLTAFIRLQTLVGRQKSYNSFGFADNSKAALKTSQGLKVLRRYGLEMPKLSRFSENRCRIGSRSKSHVWLSETM